MENTATTPISPTIGDKLNNMNIKSLDDERLKFVPKEQRKKIRNEIKQNEKERNATVVVFAGLNARRSTRGKGIVIDIPKNNIPEKGLHLTMKIDEIEEFLEDGRSTIPIYEIKSKADTYINA